MAHRGSGLVILAASFVMMACAAPSLAGPRPRDAVAQAASVPVSSLRTEGWPAAWAGRAGGGGRAAGHAQRGW